MTILKQPLIYMMSAALVLTGCQAVETEPDSQINDNTEQTADEGTSNSDITDENAATDTTDNNTSPGDTTTDSGNAENGSSETGNETPTNETESTTDDTSDTSDETPDDSSTGNTGDGSTDTTNEPYIQTFNWLTNTSTRSSWIYESNSSSGVLENIQSISTISQNGNDYLQIAATGIPLYTVLMTSELLAELNSRPKAATDFVSGHTTAETGDWIAFGEDIGYQSAAGACYETGGAGYWPPGPGCPQDIAKTGLFPTSPEPASQLCYTGLGATGYTVNGASIYNWSDGQSYQNQGAWHNLAAEAERYDVDICGGHAANSDYHHHFYSPCLADQIGDEETGHSPIYGIAADGYPIHGPWHAENTLAKSSWLRRDYDSINSATGCGGGGSRSCVLADQYNVSAGTSSAQSIGPNTSSTFTSLSGNIINAVSGVFLQDYYFDSALPGQSDEYLDEHNGHDHDGMGYHYHFTITKPTADTWEPAFPYTVGPSFYGTLHDNSVSRCSSSLTPQMGGGGGRPGGGLPPRP